MHYILNTSFQTPGGLVNRPKIGGPTRFSHDTNLNQPTLNPKFKPGTVYTLVHIKKVDDKVEYTFKSSKGGVVVETFTSCNDADNFIAEMRGETLPNYENFYKNNKS
jgi:hypothetical protein